jgi:hypothetical protein
MSAYIREQEEAGEDVSDLKQSLKGLKSYRTRLINKEKLKIFKREAQAEDYRAPRKQPSWVRI